MSTRKMKKKEKTVADELLVFRGWKKPESEKKSKSKIKKVMK